MTTLRNKMVPIKRVILAIFVNLLTMLTRQASAYRGNQKYQSGSSNWKDAERAKRKAINSEEQLETENLDRVMCI